MNSTINCGLKGQYKVDIKDGNGNVVETTDYFDNDITNIGLNYPYWYSFARCFMFLSLGIGPAIGANRQQFSGLPMPSTGYYVYDPSVTGVPPNGYPSGTYIQSGTYIGWPGYELGTSKNAPTNFDASTCGTKFTPQGVNFYRGWTIPTGLAENPQSQLAQTLTINSFMVSPSSGTDPMGCYAFSLVDRTVTIPSGYSATITYQLSLSFPTYTAAYNLFQSYTGGYTGGAVPFSFTGFTGHYTGNPSGWFSLSNSTSGTNGSETGLLALWGNLSGIYRQIYPGIELVNPLGACIIPNAGNNLEPYIIQSPSTNFYLSPDMTQFGVNKFSAGGPATGEFGAYNSNGLAANYIEFITSPSGGNVGVNLTTSDSVDVQFPSSQNDYYYSGFGDPASSLKQSTEIFNVAYANEMTNIRLENLLPISNYQNGAINFGNTNTSYATPLFVTAANQPVAFATPGSGINAVYTNYGNRAILSSSLKELPNPITSPTGNTGALQITRTNSCSKSAFIPPISCLGPNSRYGSMTLGFSSSALPITAATFYPYIDFLFFDTSGRIANMPHYRYIPDIYLTNRGTGVANVVFSITGVGGIQPGSINRFWQATGFMDSGFNNVSGFDPNNPYLLGTNTQPSSPPFFYPPGPTTLPSGYVFTGTLPTTGSWGGTGLNYGWGTVYGVIANSGFYFNPPDCGLVDSAVWSGYTGIGGIPNPTGTLLFWPVAQSGLGLNITGMNYYSPNFNQLINDSNDAYVGAGGDYLYDITGSNGISLIGTNNTFSSLSFVSGSQTIKISSTGLPISGYVLATPTTFGALTGSGLHSSQISSFVNVASGFGIVPAYLSKPSGLIRHYEYLPTFATGYRLLPNYALPNTQNINTYSPVMGGQFPGLSTENGMELYVNFTWSG